MTINNISIQKKITALLAMGILSAIIVLSYTSINSINEMSAFSFKEEEKAAATQLDQFLQSKYDQAVMLAEMEASDRSIGEAFAARDRELLLERTKDIFKKIREERGVTEFHFHLPDITSFLRINNPQKFGDSLAATRPTIVYANQKLKSASGTEMGASGIGARGVAPVFFNGEHIGSVELVFNLSNDLFSKFKKMSGIDAMLLIEKNGQLTTYANTFSNTDIKGDELLQLLPENRSVYQTKFGNQNYRIMRIELKDFSGNISGNILLFMDVTDMILQKAKNIEATSIVIFCGLIFIIAMVFFLRNNITNPLEQSIKVMEHLKNGNTEVAIPDTTRRDEIGKVYESLKQFKINLLESRRMEEEQKQAEQRMAEDRKKTTLALASQFETRVGSVVNMVQTAANDIQEMATSLASTMEETTNMSGSVSAASQQTSTSVQTVASASEQMTASISDISKNVTDITKIAGNSKMMGKNSQNDLEYLRKSVDEIESVVVNISAVSEQTNLLALNATIEAARAGDAGRGFAVVANEVKSLAGQTNKMTEEISAKVEDIRKSTANTISSMKDILEQIMIVDQKTIGVSAAIEQQKSATEDITRNVREAADGTAEVSRSIIQVKVANDENAGLTDRLKSSSNNLAEQAKQLKHTVDQFLKEVRAST